MAALCWEWKRQKATVTGRRGKGTDFFLHNLIARERVVDNGGKREGGEREGEKDGWKGGAE